MIDPKKYADEGSTAHMLAAMCLQEGKPASAYIGRLLRGEDYEHAQLSPSAAHRWMRCPGSHALEKRLPFKPRRFSHQVDEEMARHVQKYVDAILQIKTSRNALMFVEQKLPVDHITGEENATGSGDVIIGDTAAFELQAHDFKYGQGVEVEAEGNEQLAMYLDGARVLLAEFEPEGGWQTFRGVIHQPRIHDEPLEVTWTPGELDSLIAKISAGAQLARSVKENSAHGNIMDHAEIWAREGLDTLTPGDKQCKFCSVRVTCPALQKLIKETTAAELGVMPDTQALRMDKMTAIPADNEKLARLKQWTPLLRAWCDAIDSHTEAVMLAGEPVPGFKVVQGRKGNRAWADEAEAEAALKSMRLKQEQMYSFKLISPTTAEKLVESKALGDRQWKRLEEMVVQQPGKPTVVPLDDKRPALDIQPVTNELLEDLA